MGQMTQQYDAVKSLMNRALDPIKQLVNGDDKEAQRIVGMGLLAVRSEPKLAACRKDTIVTSLLQAASLGVDVGGTSGEAYLVPYKGACTLIVGYKGAVKLAYQHPEVVRVWARAVYEGDDFEYGLGLREFLTHKPCGQTHKDKLTHAYACVELKSGAVAFEVLTREQIEDRRARGQGDTPAWRKDYEAMAKKSALHALEPWIPKSRKFEAAMELERREIGVVGGHSEVLDDLPPVEGVTLIDGEAEVMPEDHDINPAKASPDELKKVMRAKKKGSKKAPPADPVVDDPEKDLVNAVAEVGEIEDGKQLKQWFTRNYPRISAWPDDDDRKEFLEALDKRMKAMEADE